MKTAGFFSGLIVSGLFSCFAEPLPPTITASFSDAAVPLHAAVTFSVRVANPNADRVDAVTMTATVADGLVLDANPNLQVACEGGGFGSVTVNDRPSTISFTGSLGPSRSECVVMVTFMPARIGVMTIRATAQDPATGLGSESDARLTVLAPPVLSMAFGAAAVGLGGSTSLTFTLVNPNPDVDLTAVSLTDTLPGGISAFASPVDSNCGDGASIRIVGVDTIAISGLTLAAKSSCTASVLRARGAVTGSFVNATSPVVGNGAGIMLTGNRAEASLLVTTPPDSFQVRYLATGSGDSVINFTNAGSLAGGKDEGAICINVYEFDAREEMESCCACRVRPNGIASLSYRTDLVNFTPFPPQSATVLVLATAAGPGACNAATQPALNNLAPGMRAWATNVHSVKLLDESARPLLGITETPFASAELSLEEFTKITSYCNFLQLVGSGFGQCKACTSRIGAQ